MYRVELSKVWPCPAGAISSAILGKSQEYLCKLYPGKGLDWAPGLTDSERNGLWEKHFDIKIISFTNKVLTVEFISEHHFTMHLLKY